MKRIKEWHDIHDNKHSSVSFSFRLTKKDQQTDTSNRALLLSAYEGFLWLFNYYTIIAYAGISFYRDLYYCTGDKPPS